MNKREGEREREVGGEKRKSRRDVNIPASPSGSSS